MTQNKLTDDIYRHLKQALFDFRLEPGERLTEKMLAASLGVSRTPVREALLRLRNEGYVEVLPRAGWQVSALDFAKFDQLYEVRVLLEVSAIGRINDVSKLAALREIWCVHDSERVDDAYQVWQLDEAFHAGLVAAAGNPELLRIHQDISERLRIVRRLDFTKPARVSATYDEHAAILRHLLAGRSSEAQRLLRAHIETSQAEVQRITLSALYEARRAHGNKISA
ncbi:MAG: GntR family transcriptional regulator [Thiohalomonadaceae bacterium]